MKRYLVLENGEVFAGLAFGAPCDTVGELVFTTGMNGYIETLTDPSYCGQIVLQTFPLIGNYGIIPADFEGKCCVRGYVVREQCQTPSNFRCEETLDAFLKENHIPGIAGIDTRAVTRILRPCPSSIVHSPQTLNSIHIDPKPHRHVTLLSMGQSTGLFTPKRSTF